MTYTQMIETAANMLGRVSDCLADDLSDLDIDRCRSCDGRKLDYHAPSDVQSRVWVSKCLGCGFTLPFFIPNGERESRLAPSKLMSGPALTLSTAPPHPWPDMTDAGLMRGMAAAIEQVGKLREQQREADARLVRSLNKLIDDSGETTEAWAKRLKIDPCQLLFVLTGRQEVAGWFWDRVAAYFEPLRWEQVATTYQPFPATTAGPTPHDPGTNPPVGAAGTIVDPGASQGH